MSNYTLNTDTNLCDFIDSTAAYDSADNIYINTGAVVTIDRSPASSLGTIIIDDGDLLIDGANATDPIHVWGQKQKVLQPAGSSGRFVTTTGWYTHSSTGDGTDNQTLDMTDYWEGAGTAGDFTDFCNGLWMEDTIEVSFDTVVGSGTPVAGDWVEKLSDPKVYGKVIAYDGSANTIQIEGWPETLADGTTIRIIQEINNEGPSYEQVWQADTASAETLVTGVWMKMVRLNKHSSENTPTRLNKKSGQGFVNTRFSNTIDFPFKNPRNGAHFRFPMITIGTVTNTSNFDSQTPLWEAAENNRYDFSGANAGSAIVKGVGWGSGYGATNSMVVLSMKTALCQVRGVML